jgi:V8-like Glu-specific endopeptidase
MLKDRLVSTGNKYALASDTATFPQWLEEAYGVPWCTSEPFYGQPAAGSCTAFKVGVDLIATAGHCVDAFPCDQMAFVFSYQMKDATTPPAEFAKNDVYFCKEVKAFKFNFDEAFGTGQPQTYEDWGIIQVDRPMFGQGFLNLRRSGRIEDDPRVKSLAVIGHPSRLPKKIAGNAHLLSNPLGDTNFFMANLDTYGGNSGSPVFSLDAQGRVLYMEGILVVGNADWDLYPTPDGGICAGSYVCPDSGCPGELMVESTVGEWVMRSTTFTDDLQNLRRDRWPRGSAALAKIPQTCQPGKGPRVKTCLSH